MYLGGPDVTTATGWPVAAGESLFLDLNTGDSPLPVETEDIVYAVTALNTQDVNVLILGESGSGKELVARAIYQHSRRSQPAPAESDCPP